MRYSISATKRQRERIPLLLCIVGIGDLQEPIRRPNGFPLWQIFYGVSGSGEFYLDGERAVLHPGQTSWNPTFGTDTRVWAETGSSTPLDSAVMPVPGS